jgi:hypothetical protein
MALPQFQKTSYGIRMMNQRLYDGTSFQITHYQVGAGGHDVTTNQPIPVDESLLELPSATTDKIAIAAGTVSQTAYDTLQFTLTLGKGVGTGAVSNIGLWASSGINSDGTLISPFLFAIANLGYRTKLANETHEYIIELVS